MLSAMPFSRNRRWVSQQKHQVKKHQVKSGTMQKQPARLKRLTDIGAVEDWRRLAETPEAQWQEFIRKLNAYKRDNGTFNVPQQYPADQAFATKVHYQKRQWRELAATTGGGHHGKISALQVAELKKIGAIEEWYKQYMDSPWGRQWDASREQKQGEPLDYNRMGPDCRCAKCQEASRLFPRSGEGSSAASSSCSTVTTPVRVPTRRDRSDEPVYAQIHLDEEGSSEGEEVVHGTVVDEEEEGSLDKDVDLDEEEDEDENGPLIEEVDDEEDGPLIEEVEEEDDAEFTIKRRKTSETRHELTNPPLVC